MDINFRYHVSYTFSLNDELEVGNMLGCQTIEQAKEVAQSLVNMYVNSSEYPWEVDEMTITDTETKEVFYLVKTPNQSS